MDYLPIGSIRLLIVHFIGQIRWDGKTAAECFISGFWVLIFKFLISLAFGVYLESFMNGLDFTC